MPSATARLKDTVTTPLLNCSTSKSTSSARVTALPGPNRSRFLLLQDLTLTRAGAHITCRIQLARDGTTASGEASELDTSGVDVTLGNVPVQTIELGVHNASIFVGYNGGHVLPNLLPRGVSVTSDPCSKKLGSSTFADLALRFMLEPGELLLAGGGEPHTAGGASGEVVGAVAQRRLDSAVPVACRAADMNALEGARRLAQRSGLGHEHQRGPAPQPTM